MHYKFTVPAGGEVSIKLRLKSQPELARPARWAKILKTRLPDRKAEADEFYATIIPESADDDTRNVMRQAFAGLLWTKQYYHYVVRDWLHGDPAEPAPPERASRAATMPGAHLYNADVISMPDKWEYPWYAAWDLAFHCVALALIDPALPRTSSSSCCASGTCIPTGRSPRMSGRLATSIRRSTPGPPTRFT